MKNLINQNIHSVCRTCLQELGEKSSLLGEKYSLHDNEDLEKLLMSCTTLALEDDVELPEFICHTCYEKLQSFYDFCCEVSESVYILTHILEESIQDQIVKEECFNSGQESENISENDECAEMGNICGKIIPTRSREKLQNYLENTVVQILQEPTKSLNFKNVNTDEIESEVEIDISDIEMNANSFLSIGSYSTKDDNYFEYLEICRESQDVQNEENSLISVQTPGLLDKQCGTDCEKLSDECSDTSEKSSTDERSNRSKIVKSKALHQNRKKTNKKKLPNNTPVEKSQISIGGGAAKFQCELCPRRCVTMENYQAHLRTHQGLKPFLCKECGHSYNKGSHLRRHMREVHEPVTQTFNCSFEGCSKVFNRESSCRMHYQLKHNPAYVSREPQSYVCEDCGKTIKTITKLKEHRYKHLPVEEYPYKCDDCGKRYKTRRTYKDHQLRHAGIKNFICPHCGVKKTTKNELRTHVNYHTKEKQWRCSKCPSVFNNSGNLGLHDRIVHRGLRPFACSYCDRTFGKQDTWKHHEMRHTGEKPHCCDLCGKRFIQVVALRAHMKTHNKENFKHAIKLPGKETRIALAEETLDSEIESVDPKTNGRNGLVQ